MKNILLMGGPNVGKSSLFSRLTGVQVVCSNYPGTTVSYCKGSMRIGEEKVDLIDVPGTYSLDPNSEAEEIATKMVHEGEIVINVVDATNLERNLYLTLQLLELGKPTIVALNMWDDAHHLGVEIDAKKLEKMLGVPVVPTVAVTAEGVKELVERLPEARYSDEPKRNDKERWARIGEIVSNCMIVHHKHHTILERIADLTVRPLTGIPLALFVLFIMFQLIITSGNWLIENILDPFFYNIYGPLVFSLVESVFPSGIVHDVLLGTSMEFTESLGLLTTGLYVPLDMVLPFVILFYFMLSLLEDVGYLPRLATLVDNLMHRIGLHGSAIVPAILGLGCNVPGALATRILETKKQRFIAATLMAICIPCLAQNAVIIALLLPYGLKYLAMVYTALAVSYVILGLILNKMMPGESPEILLEIPPYRYPNLKTLLKKTWVRVKYFLKEAVPYVMLGVLIVNLLYLFGVIDYIANLVGGVFSQLFGLPEEAVLALVIGFLRKDVAVGMLAPIGLSAEQLVIACTILAMYFPCIATFTVLLRELGLKDMLKSVVLMIIVTALVGFILKLILL